MRVPSYRVLMPLPARDFDPSEAALAWDALAHAGHRVQFATPDARPAAADPLMLSGEGLDFWSRVHGLRRVRLLGLLLRANRAAREAHARMIAHAAYATPLAWDAVDSAAFDALVLPGGHARGMREYLESMTLQRIVAELFARDVPVGAICHGVVLAARSRVADGVRSVLYGRRTTALTWSLERSAWRLMRSVGRRWDPGYYRTYEEQPGEPAGFRSVQAEVTRALADPAHFLDVDEDAPQAWRKGSGLFRDRADDARAAFVVRDRYYVSARWPGDAHAFAHALLESIAAHAANALVPKPAMPTAPLDEVAHG